MPSPLKEKEKEDTSESKNCIPESVPPIKNDDEQDVPESTSFNPTLENECVEDDLERLKGDAIGDTLYSERFVLNTLLKLGQLHNDLQEEEDVENDLCSLWDMTIEEDVVKYLLEQDVLELFAGIIKTTQDKRLSEILVGMLANMCSASEARMQLEQQDETVQVLLELTSCLDSLTLEQLMRLLAVVFVKMEETSITTWYKHILKSEHFTENLCFILTSAASNSLILQTMETLNAILAKFTLIEIPLEEEEEEEETKMPPFEVVFVNTSLIDATIETFESLHRDYFSEMDFSDGFPESVLKANQTFCNVHSILAQYGEASKSSYKPCNEKMLRCLNEILKSMARDVPLWQQYEQDVLESLNDIIRVLDDPFDMELALSLLKIYFNVCANLEQEETSKKSCNDFEDETDEKEDQVDYQVLLAIILNTIYFLVLKATGEMLQQCFSICPRKYAVKLMDSFQQPLETESLKTCYHKLKNVLDAK